MGRAPCCEKQGLKKGRWTTEEDEILVNYIKANGEGSWRSLPKNAGLLRCGKSCRLRWINYLRSDLKRGNISPEEEQVIIRLHTTIGNRWSLIAAQLPGRTDNEIKNYWNSHLSRRIHCLRRMDGDGGSTVVVDLSKIVGIPSRRRGGRTSRYAGKTETPVGTVDNGLHDQGGVEKDREMTTAQSANEKVNRKSLPTETAMEFLSPSWESGPSMCSCTTSEERKEGPAPAVEHHLCANGEECNSSAETGEESLDVDWEAMATNLWGETDEAWPWLWENAPGIELQAHQRPADCGGYEDDLEEWFL